MNESYRRWLPGLAVSCWLFWMQHLPSKLVGGSPSISYYVADGLQDRGG